jgi:glutaredoxin
LVDKFFLFVYSGEMDDQNNQINPNQPAVAGQDSSQPVVPPAQQPAQPEQPAPPASTEAAATDPSKDLQSISKDLENLAQEAAQTVPAKPAEEPAKPADAPVAAVEEPEKKEDNSQVVVYSTAKCPFCQSEKDFLNEKKLAFVEKNVEEDSEALKEMLNLSNNFAGVPVTSLNGPKGKKVVKGFTKEELVKELEEVGLLEPSAEKPSEVPAEAPAAPVQEAPAEEPAKPAEPAVEAPKVPDLP